MTDRELFQQALDCLENAIDLQQSEIDMHILHYGEWYRPQRVEFMKKYLNRTNQSIEAIRARLEQPWVKTYSGGKPNYTQPEQVAQFKFQEYGPPNWGESQVIKPEFVAEQEAMNEALRKRVMDGIPDMPIKVQDEREKNYKSFAQSAQVLGITEPEPVAWMNPKEESDGYAFSFKQQGVFTVPLYTAPPQREWVGLTDEEIQAVHYELKCAAMGATSTLGMYRILEKALREKNT